MDEIGRWSDELARDPSSLVFLQLSDALRRQGQLDVALKIALRGLERHQRNVDAHDLVARIAVERRDFDRAQTEWDTVLRIAPDHLGAMKGLGYVCFQQGRLQDAEQYMSRAAARERPKSVDPTSVFDDLLRDDSQAALLLDSGGYVLAGRYIDAEGQDVSQDVGAQLSGISDEVRRATRYLDVGEWKSITFETQAAVVAMAPAAGESLIMVAGSRTTPLGFLRRLLDRCGARAAEWLGGIEGGRA
jgi:tetratricopeptide (TPR) repeat protein